LFVAIIIPLTRMNSSEGNHSRYQLLVQVLSCLNFIKSWPSPHVLLKPRGNEFFNAVYVPCASKALTDSATEAISSVSSFEKEAKNFETFEAKMMALVCQFVCSVSSSLALESMNIASQAIDSFDVLICILEECIRCYFTNIQIDNAASENSNNININGEIVELKDHFALKEATACLYISQKISRREFMKMCVEYHAALTLRIIFEQEKRTMNSEYGDRSNPMSCEQWLQCAIYCIEMASIFVPSNEHYEYDIVVLWFFVLELIQDNRYILKRVSENAVSIERRFSSMKMIC